MFRRIGKSWFYNCAKYTRRENENRNKWLSEIPSNQREKILEELDVNKVLSYLVYKRVFSLEEYKDIWSQGSYKKRTEYFLDKLSLKGPSAFSAFCSILEEVCPNLLTCFLLGYEDCTHRHFPVSSEQTKLRAANKAEMELNETWEMSDQEGSPSAEEHLNQSFNKYSQNPTIQNIVSKKAGAEAMALQYLEPQVIRQAVYLLRAEGCPLYHSNCKPKQQLQLLTVDGNLRIGEESSTGLNCLRLAGSLGLPDPTAAPAGPPRAGCPGECPEGFWRSLRRGLHNIWATCAHALSPAEHRSAS